jgi:hypothetical protein
LFETFHGRSFLSPEPKQIRLCGYFQVVSVVLKSPPSITPTQSVYLFSLTGLPRMFNQIKLRLFSGLKFLRLNLALKVSERERAWPATQEPELEAVLLY